MNARRVPGWRAHAMLVVIVTLGCGDATGPEPPAAGEIVFTSIRERFMRIWVANADGTGQRPLTPEGETSLEPSWTPDGSRIVFTSWLDGNPDIFLMDADGSDWRPVTRDTAYDRSGRLSPDGRRVVFVSERTGDPDIWVIDVDGSNPVNLTRSPSSFDVDPDWSPDGARIVFASDRGGGRTVLVVGRWRPMGRGSHGFLSRVARVPPPGRRMDRGSSSRPTGTSVTPRST